MHDGGPSLVDTTVRRPALLLAYARAMLPAYRAHMPPVDSVVFDELDAVLRRLSRCRCADCHVPAAAALAFWWMCMHHDGTRQLVVACEPSESRWRQPAELDRLFKFVAGHILSIKTSPNTPQTAAQLVQVFQTSMFVVLSQPSAYASAIMEQDGRESTQKRTKPEKAELCALYGASAVRTYTLPPELQYLAAGCHHVPKGKKRAAAPRKRAAAPNPPAAAAAVVIDSDGDDAAADVAFMDDGTSYL